VSELDNHWGLVLVSCCCEKPVAEAVTFRQHRGRGTYEVESRYQATASEDCNRLRRPSVSYSGL
jgi:hypothetical protein